MGGERTFLPEMASAKQQLGLEIKQIKNQLSDVSKKVEEAEKLVVRARISITMEQQAILTPLMNTACSLLRLIHDSPDVLAVSGLCSLVWSSSVDTHVSNLRPIDCLTSTNKSLMELVCITANVVSFGMTLPAPFSLRPTPPTVLASDIVPHIEQVKDALSDHIGRGMGLCQTSVFPALLGQIHELEKDAIQSLEDINCKIETNHMDHSRYIAMEGKRAVSMQKEFEEILGKGFEAVDHGKQAIQQLRLADVVEMRCFCKPPTVVIKVLQVLGNVLGWRGESSPRIKFLGQYEANDSWSSSFVGRSKKTVKCASINSGESETAMVKLAVSMATISGDMHEVQLLPHATLLQAKQELARVSGINAASMHLVSTAKARMTSEIDQQTKQHSSGGDLSEDDENNSDIGRELGRQMDSDQLIQLLPSLGKLFRHTTVATDAASVLLHVDLLVSVRPAHPDDKWLGLKGRQLPALPGTTTNTRY